MYRLHSGVHNHLVAHQLQNACPYVSVSVRLPYDYGHRDRLNDDGCMYKSESVRMFTIHCTSYIRAIPDYVNY